MSLPKLSVHSGDQIECATCPREVSIPQITVTHTAEGKYLEPGQWLEFLVDDVSKLRSDNERQWLSDFLGGMLIKLYRDESPLLRHRYWPRRTFLVRSSHPEVGAAASLLPKFGMHHKGTLWICRNCANSFQWDQVNVGNAVQRKYQMFRKFLEEDHRITAKGRGAHREISIE